MEDRRSKESLICIRAAKEIKEGMLVNLGIGMPVEVASYVPADAEILFHTENGALGFGGILSMENADWDCLNAAGNPVSMKPGGCFFHSGDAFDMMRGKKLDLAIIGAYEVNNKGDIANYRTKVDIWGSPGGCMDLASGAKVIMALMLHTTNDGKPRIVNELTLPATGRDLVTTILTDCAFIEVTKDGLVLREIVPGMTPEKVQAITEPKLIIPTNLKEMAF